ncbi:succinylglutamate desuccinylase/aspartoacylase family protein [Halioxenophilus sp. WMMB6]|uniref:succinylglutamate desuccinylase/aspartoacylase domain-containing protein n=1 Tax=Halioxenophilus sp. WMMB6 TaxID=3073815 RepID=UPI00295E2CC1|nr:succinylglutamate desuccinylase/aspartoacylase family protein [Halioxenophilus sp. WMMB6]
MDTTPVIDYLNNPTPEELGRTPLEFLAKLEKPTLINIRGRDSSRVRVISTLLHGNEPSGFFAVHRWLCQQQVPPVSLLFFIGNVAAARLSPTFSQRQLPDGRDFNRCFKEPFDGPEGKVAEAFLAVLQEIGPEALVDIHNTSGTGPGFVVSVCNDRRHQALTALFTERMLFTPLRLGSLMEYSENAVPSVTFECGGAQDEHAHQAAWEGLLRFIDCADPFALPEADWDIEVLTNPVRVELVEDVTVAYGERPVSGCEVTFRPDIEHFNFGVIGPEIALGQVGPRGLACFRVVDSEGRNVCNRVLRLEAGQLFVAQPIKAFMITSNAEIAKSDCLMYVVTAAGGGFI